MIDRNPSSLGFAAGWPAGPPCSPSATGIASDPAVGAAPLVDRIDRARYPIPAAGSPRAFPRSSTSSSPDFSPPDPPPGLEFPNAASGGRRRGL
eukprot:328987-Pyramimonas_sp.AAC.1